MEHTPILPPSAPLESIERFLPSEVGIEPLSAVARALRGFNRDQLGSAIEVLIALMDVVEGDPDAEDATDAEDDFALSPLAIHFTGGAGCLIADEDAGSYVEWQTLRGRAKGGQCQMAGHEDAEEDDDAGQCSEDEISCGWPEHGRSGPGCVISDPDTGIEDRPEGTYGLDC